MTAAHAQHDQQPRENVEVIEMSRAQYDAAKRQALKDLGITYEQLREQARRRQFTSPRARRLWVIIGGSAT